MQDFIAPELRGIQERLDAIDRRFAALKHTIAADKAELLRTIDFMIRELSLRIELAAVKSGVAEAAPIKASSIEHKQ